MAVLDVRYFLGSTTDRAGTPSFYDPILLARVLHLPPVTPSIADILYLSVHVGAGAVLIGGLARLPRMVQHGGGLVLAGAFSLWAMWGMSYGYVSHDHMAITVGIVLLTTAGTARYGSGAAADERAGWPLRMIQVFTVLTYFGSVMAKFSLSGGSLLRWANSGTLAWAFIRRPNEFNQLFVANAALLRVGQWGALMLELFSPLVFLLRARSLMLAVAAFAGFHLTTYLLLGIHFLPTAVCWTAFLPLERLPGWFRRIMGRATSSRRSDSDVAL